jgi:hypothetical protein
MIRCLILKNGTLLISEISEIDSEIGEPDCQLINPYEIIDEQLVRWPKITEQKSILINSDSILTLVEPLPKILLEYQNIFT